MREGFILAYLCGFPSRCGQCGDNSYKAINISKKCLAIRAMEY